MINISIEKARKVFEDAKFDEGIKDYRYIMDRLHKCDVSQDEEFQRTYDRFYKVRRDEHFRKIYFEFMEKNKSNRDLKFGEILRYMHEKVHSVEPSFSSKMLHTINRDVPIWDENVLKHIEEKYSYSKNDEDKVNLSEEIHEKLCADYEEYLKDTESNANAILKLFGKEYADISDTKKIDFILWLTRDA